MDQSAAAGARSSYVRIREAIIDDLQERELFREIPEDKLNALIGSAWICSLGPDENLWPADEPAKHLFAIIEGNVAIWANSAFDPHQETFLAWRGKEDILFETLLAWRDREFYTGRRRNDSSPKATIKTRDSCTFLEIENRAFDKFAESCPLIFRNLARLLVKKMSFEKLRSEVIEALHPNQRIARALLSIAAERLGQAVESLPVTFTIPGPIHQVDLAGYVGHKYETVNRNLSALRKAKIILYVGHGDFTISDSHKLREIGRAQLKSARKPKTQS